MVEQELVVGQGGALDEGRVDVMAQVELGDVGEASMVCVLAPDADPEHWLGGDDAGQGAAEQVMVEGG